MNCNENRSTVIPAVVLQCAAWRLEISWTLIHLHWRHFTGAIQNNQHKVAVSQKSDNLFHIKYFKIEKCVCIALGVPHLEDGKLGYHTNHCSITQFSVTCCTDFLWKATQWKLYKDSLSYRANGWERKFRLNEQRVIQCPPSSTLLRRRDK